MRDLVVTYRRVPTDRIEAYDDAWTALGGEARQLGCRAWRFRSADAGDEFIEFLEGASREDPLRAERLGPLRDALDRLAPAPSSRRWEEAPARGQAQADERLELLFLLRSRSLRRGDFLLASGKRSTYYIDARPTTMSAAGQRLIGRLGLAELDRRGWRADAAGGLTLGADPVAYAIAHSSALAGRPMDAFTVRKQAKEHGTSRRIEGNLPAPGNVVVLEDVMTSGASALEAARTVSAAGAAVLGVLTVVDRQAGGAERLAEEGYPVAALFTAAELLGG